MAIDKRFEMMDDDLENIAGGRTYGYGTNFYMTVQTNQSYLPLLATPEKNSANELSKLYTGDQVELVMPYDTTYLYVFDMKTGQYGYVEGNSLVDPRTGKKGMARRHSASDRSGCKAGKTHMTSIVIGNTAVTMVLTAACRLLYESGLTPIAFWVVYKCRKILYFTSQRTGTFTLFEAGKRVR